MKFCPECGTGHDCEVQGGDRMSDVVRIAELETRRDIEVAKVNARADRAALDTAEVIAEVEADAEVEAAEVQAVVLGEAIEAAGTAEPEPVIIDVPGQPDPEPEPDDGELPPAEGSPAPEPAEGKSRGLGMW